MLDIHFLNVGDGDCIILQQDSVFGVIDCNRTPSRQSPALDTLRSLGAKSLSFVCLTHPDRDHYSGLLDVLRHYEGKIDTLFTFPLGDYSLRRERVKELSALYIKRAKEQDNEKVLRNTEEFVGILLQAAKNFLPKGNWIELTGDFSQIAPKDFKDIQWYAIHPPPRVKGPYFQALISGKLEIEEQATNNALSSAIFVSHNGISVLLGGDVPRENWDTRHTHFERRGGPPIASDVVKLPHHGASRDCTPKTMGTMFASDERQRLPIAVVSADGKRHPKASVIDWLIKNKIEPYCTSYFHGWRGVIRTLLNDPALDPEFNRVLNEYGDLHLAQSIPCQGDIKVSIRAPDDLSVTTSNNRNCLCKQADRLLI